MDRLQRPAPAIVALDQMDELWLRYSDATMSTETQQHEQSGSVTIHGTVADETLCHHSTSATITYERLIGSRNGSQREAPHLRHAPCYPCRFWRLLRRLFLAASRSYAQHSALLFGSDNLSKVSIFNNYDRTSMSILCFRAKTHASIVEMLRQGDAGDGWRHNVGLASTAKK